MNNTHSVGFPISHKENELRRALIPDDVEKCKYKNNMYFESGYGEILGYSDQAYEAVGANIACRKDVLEKEIICDPKIGDADYLMKLEHQTVFGWLHAVQNQAISSCLINRSLTAYAWEDMFEDGRHVFFRNNEIAGEAAIMHAFQCLGAMPYHTKVALLGRGNVANGALKILTLLGADVTIYGRHCEKLFQKELGMYDVIVNAILWDTSRTDHIVYLNDLDRMKPGAMIVDISCDFCGAIESSVPTSISSPTYVKNHILHYVVDHTPSLFYKTATKDISKQICRFIDQLIENKTSSVLNEACIVKCGKVIDQRIIEFQRKGE